MNVFSFEFRRRIKSTMVWLVIILCLMGLFVLYYPIFIDSKEAIVSIIGGMDDSFLKVFGMDIDSIFSFYGYYSFCYIYISVVMVIFASMDAIEVFGREKQDKCLEFLYVKPISRSKIFFSKLLVIMVNMLIINIVYSIFLLIIFKVNTDNFIIDKVIVLMILGMVLTYLVFSSIGIFYVYVTKKIRNVAGVATTFGIVGFVMSSIVNLLEKDYLSVIAPLKYFNVSELILNKEYNIRNVVAFIIVFVGMMITSFVINTKKDLKMV